MALSSPNYGILFLVCLVYFAGSAHAFGAGNIGSTSKIEGQNWRHGDIEDALLTILMARAAGGKKFSKLDVKRVYFGNWLRDYSQAVDTGTLKYVSSEAITLLLWILGFMTFGYATKEFEVTSQRLGCYRPEEHIDNPKNYNDNNDAREYDRRLRGPVDERRELSVDPDTGLKNYIANERINIETSAGLVRKVFGRSIQLGRQYARSKNKADLYEALRLLGTGCHCLEDYSAHSNYTELALIELGERDIFPHVGRRSQVQIRGLDHPVFPCVTGTFGPTDFLHSVMGEFSDKATQSEIQNLESTMNQAQNNQGDASMLQDLLNKVPEGLFGGENEAQKADDLKQNAQAHQMQNTRVSPRDPEAWVEYINDVQEQIRPILEWHDEVMKGITETVDSIPILPDLIEQLQEQVNIFVFSLLAPYMIPVITQVKRELNTGSNEIIESSEAGQHVVFHDDNSTDPTHSMLAKDHFSNVLNEPAGKVASQVVKWVVPQLIACWDDESIDVNRTLTRIVSGVLHHPALRDYGQDGASDGRRLMFGVVEKWWGEQSSREKDGLRQQLDRRGIQEGRNHKPGVVDHGHGSAKPLGMPKLTSGGGSSSGIEGAVMGGISEALGGGSSSSHKQSSGGGDFGSMASKAAGGGALGGIIGGIAGGLLGGAFGEDDKKATKSEHQGRDGSHNQTYSEYGQSGNTYGQAQFSRTERHGEREEQYTRYEQREASSGGYGTQQLTETARYDNSGQQTYHHEERTSYGSESQNEYGSSRQRRDSGDNEDNRRPQHHQSSGYGSSERRRDDDNEYGSSGYGERRRGSNDNDNEYGSSRQSGGNEYGRESSGGYGGGGESENRGYGSGGGGDSYGESRGYGGDDNSGRGGYGGNNNDEDENRGYGGRRDDDENQGYGGGGGGGNDNQGYGGGGGGDYDEDGNRRRYDY